MKRGLNILFCLSIILILSLSFVSAGFFGDLWNRITGQATSECVDPDSNLPPPAYYYQKGSVTIGGNTYWDYCSSESILKEGTCSELGVSFSSYECPVKCEGGACVDCSNTELCSDNIDNDCDGMINEGCGTTPSKSVSRGDITITGCIDEDGGEYYHSFFVSSRSCLTFIYQGGSVEELDCIPDYCVGEENPRLLKEAECRSTGSYSYTSYYNSLCDIRCENGACVRPPPLPDTTFPTINITYPNSGIQSSPPDTFSFVASDDIGLSLCQYSLDGGTTKNDSSCEASIHGLQPAVGSHTWIVYATDTSGNTATQSVTFIVEEAKTSVPEVVTPPCQGTDTDCYNRETGACDDCTAIPAGLLTCDILGDIAGYKFRCSNRGCVGKAFREKITDCNYGCFRYEINDARCLAQPEEGDEVFTIGSPHRSWCPNGYYCSNQRPWFCWEQRCCYAGQQTPGCN